MSNVCKSLFAAVYNCYSTGSVARALACKRELCGAVICPPAGPCELSSPSAGETTPQLLDKNQ